MKKDIVDNFSDKTCSDCGSRASYSMKCDAFLCKKCNKWLEKTCSDSNCNFCAQRSVKPI